MEKMTNWVALWRELVEAQKRSQRIENDLEKGAQIFGSGKSGWSHEDDPWSKRAREFDSRSSRRGSETGAIRQIVAERIGDGATVLDIGAGTGRWTAMLAKRAAKVTAVEPSPAMTGLLREKLVEEGLSNIEVVQGFWPEVEVETHDISFCSHSVYFSPDLPRFVRAMVATTRRSCYLVLRAPLHEGVMADAARRIWGQPHDSPNFVVAYNVLLEMGIMANVVFDSNVWEGWRSRSIEAAVEDTKRRLGVLGSNEHDSFLGELLRKRLRLEGGEYLWPPAIRSALVYWEVT